MDAVTPAQPEGPASALGSVRTKLRHAEQVARLAGDPVADGYAVLSDFADALDTTVASLSASIRTIETALEQARRPFTQDILGPVQRAAAAGATEEVLSVARAIRWRASVFVGATVAIVALIACGAGLSWGRASAEDSFRTTQANLQAAFQHGPKDAARWLALMRWNDIGDALQHCQAFTGQASGRHACMVPLWIAPPRNHVPGS